MLLRLRILLCSNLSPQIVEATPVTVAPNLPMKTLGINVTYDKCQNFIVHKLSNLHHQVRDSTIALTHRDTPAILIRFVPQPH